MRDVYMGILATAGGTNYRSTSLRQGFAGHPNAWNHHEVEFYAHAVEGRK